MKQTGRILVIDDSWTILEAIRRSLSAEGYDVKVANDLADAVKHVRNTEVCIVDFHMPGRDGKSTLVALRAALDAGQRCKFYLYTSDLDVAKRATELGFDGSFMKKGDTALLSYQVSAALRSVRLEAISARPPGDSRPPASKPLGDSKPPGSRNSPT